MALDKFQPYLFVSAGEQSNKYLTPVITNGIAQFQAQRAQSLTGLTVRIDPIQEGTGDPAPDNIRPISGRTGLTVTRAGRNLLKLPYRDTNGTRNGVTFTTHADGSVTINGTASPAVGGTLFTSTESDLPLNVGDVLYFSAGHTYNENSAYLRLLYADNFSGIGRITRKNFALTLTAAMIERGFVFQIWVPNGVTVNNMTFKPMMSNASIEEWQSPTVTQTYPITWETESGTVYGGTLDVVSGVLTVDKGFAVYDGTEQWRRDSSGNFFVSASEKMPDRQTGLLTAGALIMNMFVSSANTVGGAWVSTGGYLNVKPADIADTSEFTALLASNNLQIVYPLATPQTYQLTGTEVRTITGYNQIYSDAGPIIDIKF